MNPVFFSGLPKGALGAFASLRENPSSADPAALAHPAHEAHLIAIALLALAAPSQAQDAPEPPPPASVVAAAPAADWRAIDPADLLVMTLAPDRDGNPRTVMIQLMPAPFSQGWAGNVRTLAKAHWWDGTTVYRVVDNWVAQWGDGEDDKEKAEPLPEGLRVVPESEYVARTPR